MSELDDRTVSVAPTLTDIKLVKTAVSYDQLQQDIKEMFKLTPEEAFLLKQGINTEKNKRTDSLRIFQEIILNILEKDKKEISDINTEAVYIQNKKIIKDMAVNNFNLLKNYNSNDREVKIILLGKIIQSLYDSK